MKRRSLLISHQAEEDLASIWWYVAQFSAEAADRCVQRLRTQIAALEKNAELGRPYPPRPGLRTVPMLGYVVFYSIDNGTVSVAHVVHGARDIERVLEGRD